MSEWWSQARELRLRGWKLADIAERFGVTRSRAHQVCAGVECPVDHHALHFRDPEWRKEYWRPRKPVKRHEGEEFIRANYNNMPAREIGAHLGITKNAVIGRARDLGLVRSKGGAT